jgi:hypothetical protein
VDTSSPTTPDRGRGRRSSGQSWAQPLRLNISDKNRSYIGKSQSKRAAKNEYSI